MIFLGLRGRKKLAEQDERLEKLERASRELQMEWLDTYDKLQHIAGRLAKRVKKQDRLPSPDEPHVEYDEEERKHLFRMGLIDTVE